MHGENILDEVRRIRREYVAEFGGDLDAIYRDLKRREQASGRKCVNLRVSNQRQTKKTRHRVKSQ